MSESGPYFYAWCDEADRVDAFATAVFASDAPLWNCTLQIGSIDPPHDTWSGSVSLGDVAAAVRLRFGAGTYVDASTMVNLSSGRLLGVDFRCFGEGYELQHPAGPLHAAIGDRKDLIPFRLEVAVSQGARAVEVEAAVQAMRTQHDIEDLMTCFCAPDASGRVTTGACTEVWGWGAPVETCATYHADAASVARDLALSWVHLHDGDKVERAAGMSLTALHSRVAAAPPGASVAVAGNPKRALEHLLLERAAATSRETRHATLDAARRGARVAIAGDAELSRETVLRALAAPPGALLEALEASAVPDDSWRAVEPLALETIEATKAGAPTYEVDVSTRRHVQFLERHAPYHVRRLPNGGVLLATHPYRTLWQLYADALFLLGITP